MSKPSAAPGILAGLDEVIEDLEQDPMEGEPFVAPHFPLTVDQFDCAGELLFGRNWKTEMAEIKGWKDASRVRAMLRGSRPIPKSAGYELLAQLRSRAQSYLDLVEEIEASDPEQVAAE